MVKLLSLKKSLKQYSMLKIDCPINKKRYFNIYTVIIIFFFLIYAICIILYNTFVVDTGFLKVGGRGVGGGGRI